MNITKQGVVQVTVKELLDLPFEHYYSAADVEHPADRRVQHCGSVTNMTGFTEWVSANLAPVSIGWDWTVSFQADAVRWQRVSSPRTNIQVLDAHGSPLDWEENLHVLATWVDAQFWVQPVVQSVSCPLTDVDGAYAF